MKILTLCMASIQEWFVIKGYNSVHTVYIFNPFLKTTSLFLRMFFKKILNLCMASIQEWFVIEGYNSVHTVCIFLD